MKCPELSKEFGDVFRFWLASIPTAAEAAEVELLPDGGLSRDSARPCKVAVGAKFKITSAGFRTPGTSFGGNFEATH